MAAIRSSELDPWVADPPVRRRHLQVVPAGRHAASSAVHRRRRLVVGVVVAVLLVAALRASAPDEGGLDGTRAPGLVHVVRPGDTYWSIASSLGGSDPILETVEALVAANGDALLQPGDRLHLPG